MALDSQKEISIYNKDIKTPKTVLKKAVVKKYAPRKNVAKKSAPKKATKQSGSSSLFYDKLRQAKKPGKRKTAWGTTYYESRANRSDKGVLLGMHKDTKSHNVNIRVMSGIKKDDLIKLTKIIKEIEFQENTIKNWQKNKKELVKKEGLKSYNINLKLLKNRLMILKRHKTELKKLL